MHAMPEIIPYKIKNYVPSFSGMEIIGYPVVRDK